jgi:hypothetical protein
MKRHLSTEQLSSFMDGEVGAAETREVEVHLASCPACRARLGSMRRLITEIRRMERPVPPPDLGYQVHAQIAAQGDVRTLRARARDLFRSLVFQPSFRVAALGLAVAVAVAIRFLAVPPVPPPDGSRPQIVTVRTTFGEPPLGLPETTSEVAGREFVLSGDRWVQKGLKWAQPDSRVMVASPEGQDMINKYSDLMLLLTDGSRVVMQYRLATVELSKG